MNEPLTADTAAADQDAVIELRGVRKSFGDLEVLKGVDLTVARGEVVVIIGPSGGGKSTLLRCVNLLEPITAGKSSWSGGT
jgi:ABC-type polar amino acid transport system ATPase subunit